MDLPWTEKYRAQRLNDICSQPLISKLAERISEYGDDHRHLTNLLFYGSPGCGKSSTARALCYALFGPAIMQQRVREFNASEDRGIAMVREKIKHFATLMIGRKDRSEFPCPDLKIIILDEADCLTNDAQAALRHLIENYSKTTRFIFICNNVDKLSDAIQSRCFRHKFRRIQPDAMISRLNYICTCEKIEIKPDIINSISLYSKGDLRKAINVLQGCIITNNNKERHFDFDLLHQITGSISRKQYLDLTKVLNHDNDKNMCEFVEALIADGADAQQLLDKLSEYVIECGLDAEQQLELLSGISKRSAAIQRGSDQLIAAWFICMTIRKTLSKLDMPIDLGCVENIGRQ